MWMPFLIFSFVFAGSPESTKPQLKQISGVVRLIRGEPETQVFFKDLNDSVIIPKDSKHNEIFAMCNDSMKTGKSISLMMDPVSHRAFLPTDASKSSATVPDQSPDSSD
jgi:hypothetical protein